MSIKIAIVGTGNCASSLVQGIQYYSANAENIENYPGLMFQDIGGHKPGDIEVVAAFDVDSEKVGATLATALQAGLNNTLQFSCFPEHAHCVLVHRGPTLDGLGQYLQAAVKESNAPVCDIERVLRTSGAQVVVNYLPVGSEEATLRYAEAAVMAGCAFVNCIPVFLASNPQRAALFEKAGLPIIGDDVKSQVGATIVHRVLATLMRDRGVHLDRTYQLNVGGNADFLNMLERERTVSKKISKTQAVTSVAGVEFAPGNVHIGPSDHVPWLTDRKLAFIRLEGRGFGGAPINLEVRLEVWDSPNSAGVVIDAIRCAKLALDRGLAGALLEPSAYYMKSPPEQVDDSNAYNNLWNWLIN